MLLVMSPLDVAQIKVPTHFHHKTEWPRENHPQFFFRNARECNPKHSAYKASVIRIATDDGWIMHY